MLCFLQHMRRGGETTSTSHLTGTVAHNALQGALDSQAHAATIARSCFSVAGLYCAQHKHARIRSASLRALFKKVRASPRTGGCNLL